MKMFCPPTDKTCKRCQKGAEWGLLAVLALFVSGSADIFEISTHGHFRQLIGCQFVSVLVELNQSSASSMTVNFFEFNKRRQFFIRTHNKSLPSPRCVSAIQIVRPLESIAENTAPTPTGFAEIVSDNFPVLPLG
jgi:hypothetical protein